RPDVIDFKRYVSRATWGQLSLADVALVEGDLAIRGERIDRVPEDWRELMRSMARERHKAFNWLLGFAPTYSEVETTTSPAAASSQGVPHLRVACIASVDNSSGRDASRIVSAQFQNVSGPLQDTTRPAR